MEQPESGGASRHRFRLGPLLGAGTFGEVYLARMTSPHGIEQDVAVKLLNPGLSPKSQPVARMRDEGRMLAALNHPAILSVLDFCFLDGRIGLVTEFVPGADLHECIFGSDPIPPRAALQAIGLCADALDAAFEARTDEGRAMHLVHRDIKPANVRITPHGSVKVLDFGIAKSEDERRETETTERAAIGTPSYMAPEVQSYEVLDALPSRDVFALGCTLYEALVGELFFEGLGAKEIGRLCTREERFAAWRAARLQRLTRFGPRVVDLVSRMLRYDHHQRPSAREVADACSDVAEKLEGETLRAWCRRRAWPAAGDKAGPWSGRKLEDAGMASRIEVRAASATLDGLLDDDRTGRFGAHPPANPTLIATDDVRASQLVQQAVQEAVRTMAQAQPTTVVVVPQAELGRKRRKGGRRFRPLEALVSLAALGVVVVALVAWQRPELLGPLARGDLGALMPERGVAELAAEPAAVDEGAEVVTGEAWLWGATPSDAVGTVKLAVTSASEATLSRAGSVVPIARSGEAKIAPGPVEVRPQGGGAPLRLAVAAGDRVVVDCGAEACVTVE